MGSLSSEVCSLPNCHDGCPITSKTHYFINRNGTGSNNILYFLSHNRCCTLLLFNGSVCEKMCLWDNIIRYQFGINCPWKVEHSRIIILTSSENRSLSIIYTIPLSVILKSKLINNSLFWLIKNLKWLVKFVTFFVFLKECFLDSETFCP